MANVTKGSITSQFPDGLPVFAAQSEALDPTTEDTTIAEGRDANKWSAEIQAISEAIGIGGRGGVSVVGTTATVEALKYVYQGTQKSYTGTTGLSLFTGQNNKIYLDPSDNTAKVSISSWPTIPHIRLASWDDSTSGVASVVDERSHDLRPSTETPAFAYTSGLHVDAGSVTVLEGQTSIAIAFHIEFASTPIINLTGRRPSDSTLRVVGISNILTTGATVHINSAAPSGGVEVHWVAFGMKSSGVSGSGA